VVVATGTNDDRLSVHLMFRPDLIAKSAPFLDKHLESRVIIPSHIGCFACSKMMQKEGSWLDPGCGIQRAGFERHSWGHPFSSCSRRTGKTPLFIKADWRLEFGVSSKPPPLRGKLEDTRSSRDQDHASQLALQIHFKSPQLTESPPIHRWRTCHRHSDFYIKIATM